MGKRCAAFLAPVAMGFTHPTAATSAELGMSAMGRYSTREQVTSVTQFSDVRPTDWAYQALTNLIERYGCVAGYPDATFMGSRVISRYGVKRC